MTACYMFSVYEVILLVSIHMSSTNAETGLLKRQVLTVYSGKGIRDHFDKYYGEREGYQEWPRLQSLNYRDRNVLCLITYKATNVTTDMKFRTTKVAKSVLPYYIWRENRTVEMNVNRCFVSKFEQTKEGDQVEIPWYDFYLAEAEKDHCVYRFSFPQFNGKEEIWLKESGVHALKLICDIDFLDYEIALMNIM